ncbi:MAG: cadherin-like beta sandwich domain-containing protein [Pseudobacter sp.]|uniref:cadherin-like beta sandwich domain-containing protein n=1 Tax=Pseudobacter sp. TaxID=2045420 RepID=UPI003F7E768F
MAQVATTTVFAGAGGTPDYYVDENNDALTAKFAYPGGIAMDADGNLYVSDGNNRVIRKITPDGKVILVAGVPKQAHSGSIPPTPSGPALSTPLLGPFGPIAVAGNGIVYFAGTGDYHGKIVNGNVSYFRAKSMTPNTTLGNSRAFKIYGNTMYRASGGMVSVVNLATEEEYKRFTIPNTTAGSNHEVRALAVDPSGTWLYALSINGTLARVNLQTDVVTVLVSMAQSTSEMWIITGDLAADASGNVYLMGTHDRTIIKCAAGTWARSTVTSTAVNGGVSGMVIAPNGDFYISDYKLHRIYRTRWLQNNANLSALTTSTGTLSPAFVKTTISYTMSVPNDVDKISVTPTVEQADATIKAGLSGSLASLASGTTSPEYNLAVGTNTIQVAVTAQNGAVRTYSIVVTRMGIPPPTPINFTTTMARLGVNLTWEAAPGANRYKIYRGTTAENLTLLTATPVSGTTYSDNTAQIGTTYYYAIVAMEAAGAESPQGTAVPGARNTPPVVSNLQTTGFFMVGKRLTAEYDYSDVENHGNVSTYQWYRSNTATGTGKAAISQATSNSYSITAADLGKYLSVRVTPNDGISAGTFRESGLMLIQEGALPVKLAAFTAKQVNSGIQLNWQTATEINSSFFLLQRSSDARNWKEIAKLNAAGESNSVIQYGYTDRTPASGRNFYRLMMVDRDGYTEFSDIVIAGANAVQKGISLYPVPAGSFIFAEAGSQAKDLIFVITDTDGKEVKRGRLMKPVEQININDLKSGVYYFKAANNNAIKFVKQ